MVAATAAQRGTSGTICRGRKGCSWQCPPRAATPCADLDDVCGDKREVAHAPREALCGTRPIAGSRGCAKPATRRGINQHSLIRRSSASQTRSPNSRARPRLEDPVSQLP